MSGGGLVGLWYRRSGRGAQIECTILVQTSEIIVLSMLRIKGAVEYILQARVNHLGAERVTHVSSVWVVPPWISESRRSK